MIISIQGKTQSKGKAASCARTGFKAFSLSMMAIKAMNSVTASPGHHSAYVKNDGDLWTSGKNSDGQLGLFNSSDVDTPTIVSVGNFAVSLGGGGASLGGGGGGVSLGGSIHFGVAKVAIGNGHTLYVREQNGTHYAFSSGRNHAGQLGLGHQFSQSWISHLPFSESVREVAAGDNFSLFLTQSGALYGTGANDVGQLGLGHDNNVSNPQLITQEGVRQVAAGFHHSLYVMKDGSLWGTGRNLFGQLGLGDQVDRNRSTLVFPSGVRQVSAGKRHSLIVKTDGSLWAMGRNDLGQLGTGGTNDSLVPTLIEPGGVKQASAGLDHSLFVKWDGTLWGMGNNNYGELGLGNQSTQLIPVQIDGNVTQVAAGFDHTHYLKTDGTLWAMGENGSGSLGTGDKLMKTTPVQVDSNVMRLADVPDNWPVLDKLTNPYGAHNDYFGSSLDQSGNFLSVGSSSADPGGISNAGAAYVYQMDTNGSATFLSTVTAPDKAASDQFGNSISMSGNVLAVAASGADPAGISNAGAAYLFRLENNGSATFLSKVTAPDKATSDSFGNSISISGNILAVGAYDADPGGKNSAGAAYLFQLENNGSATFLSKVTAPNGAANDRFGKSVSLSGNILAVGAYGVTVPGKIYVGAAYVYFVEANGSATLLTQITPPNNPNFDNFGFCVSLDGKTLSVGAGYGSAKGFIQAGAVYVYHLENNNSATLLTKLTAPDAAANKFFGMRVSLSGSILAASTYDPNAAYVFDLSTLPRSLPGDRDGDGFSDALEANATTNPDSNLSFPSLDYGLLARYPLGGTTVVRPGKIEPDTFHDKELGIHFDASAIQGLSNLANVTVWQDLSGNDRHMSNVPSPPRWIASEPSLNNKPVVDFNESEDRMWTSYNFRATDQVAKWRDEGWTAIAVARYTAGPDGDSERLISSNGGNWFMGLQGQNVNRHFFEGWVDPGSNHDNNWHLFCVVHQGNSINADPQSWTYDLGTPRVSASAASDNDWHMPQRLEFGAYNNNSENSMGQIAEFLMYHGMLTDEQRQKIESHLAFKYGLTLDANHPFGSTVDALDKSVEVPTDLSGNERNGTARNTLLRPDRYGRHGKALGFSDQNQTILLPELPAGDHGFTVSGWVRSDSNGGEIFSLGDESRSGLFLHLEANGSISWGTGHPTLRAYANAPSNTWYHLAATYQPDTHAARIYLNGVLAGSATLLGGFEPALYAKQAIPLGSLDLSGGMPPGVSHAVRSQSAFVASSGGTVRFRVNSGTSGDIYRVWMGNLCLFSAGNAFTGPDHTQNYDAPPGFSFPGNGWRTSGSAANGDDDQIEITFATGQPTTYKITPGTSNDDGTGNSAYNSYDPVSGLYANVLTNDLPSGAADQTLTLQVETTSIGIIYGKGTSANNDADNSGTPGPSFTPMTFPRIGSGFNGSLDDFRLYSRSLLPGEIMQIKNSESAPSDLNFTAPLAFAENQPIGTVVGEFNATDPDAGAILTYSLVSGPGDGNNSLFTLETNGTLKTATTFDFESNASSYSIRVQVKDEFNATAEGNFTVMLTDLYEPSQPNHFVDLNSSINLEMIWVEPGTFMMGQSNISSASPVHQVTLTKGFYLGKHEVTQAQYEAVMKGNAGGLSSAPSTFGGNPNHPVERVSHNDIQIFLQRLNDQEAHNLPAGWKYVLPTEAQWEYACRAGSTTVYSWGNTLAADNANWNHGSDPNQTMDVGLYTPNAWGFHDMHGNVYEWTADWHAPYTSNAKTDPEGPASAAGRSNRGGSWTFDGTHLPVARRFSNLPTDRFNYIGFRLAYRQITSPPTNLNSTAPLAFSENQPIGTVVGEFNATDPDVGATLTYSLVSGAGDGNNSLFTLDQNGTLKTATTFDFESNASSYSIRVQAKDEFNATAEGNFTIMLTDVSYEPSQPNHFVDLNSTVNLEMIWVEPGTFTMGSTTSEVGRQSDREDEHNVTLTKGFYLGKHEVTQAQYEAVMTGNTNSLSPTPSEWLGNPNRPVEKVSWNDAQVFLTRLNAQQAANLPAGWSYVLPTESQWEYACRAGTTTAYSWGNTIASSNANYNASGINQTRDVGQYSANPWGFFDMHGNVWEWTADRYQAAYPIGNPVVDPTGPASGSARVRRGGSWYAGGTALRSAGRRGDAPSYRPNTLGFRLAFKQTNNTPTSLNFTSPLSIAENQPVGTFVGQFTAHDPDANASLSYRLANGPGSKHNDRFSLDANGTLRTAKVFDYENRTRFKIRVQVADEHNVSIHEAFIVSVTDLAESNGTNPDSNGTQVLPDDSNATTPDANGTRPGTPAGDLFQPIVETREAKKTSTDSATLRGSLVDNGGARITERGFLLSAKPNPKPGRKNVTLLDANGSKNFQAQATELKPGKKYFYRAFATNAEGTALGSVESFTTTAGPPSPSWINAQPGAAANWWTSRWFGNFYLNANGWARHEKLGWVFPMESPTAGLWLWKRDLGWLWTEKEIYPFLYQNAQGGWLYFYGEHRGTRLFYDYVRKKWTTLKEN